MDKIFDSEIYLTQGLVSPHPRAIHMYMYYNIIYSDTLKNSFFLRTMPLWNSLPSSVVSSKTREEYKALI